MEKDFQGVPLGVQGTFGGCVKGVRAPDNSYCHTQRGTRRTDGIYASLAACCSALVPLVKGAPDLADVEVVCNSYKRAAAKSAPQPEAPPGAAKSGSQPAAAGTQPQAEGPQAPQPQMPPVPGSQSQAGQGPKGSSAAPSAPSSAEQPPQAAKGKGQAPRTVYVVFKGVDLPPAVNWMPPTERSSNEPRAKVCGGKEAVAKACSKSNGCKAFTFGGDGDCGWLKFRYFDDAGGARSAPAVLFTPNPKANTYVADSIVPQASGGAVDCKDPKNAGVPCCELNGALPAPAGTLAT